MTAELAVVQPAPSAAPQLLDAMRPAERIALLTEMANVVKDVIERQGWFKQIGPKKHIYIQGWTFIGGLGGCSAKTTHTEKIEGGYKAHASVVRVDTGIEVGAAEQVCMSAETKWKGKDDYALTGMASTRACSRALSTVFRHVVELAGYSATPAEEMTQPEPLVARRAQPVVNHTPKLEELLDELYGLFASLNLPQDRAHSAVEWASSGRTTDYTKLEFTEAQGLIGKLNSLKKQGAA